MNEEFSTFEEVENIALRAYNRVVMAHNIQADFGIEPLKQYIDNFNEEDRRLMFQMMLVIEREGPEAVLKQVMATVIPEDEIIH